MTSLSRFKHQTLVLLALCLFTFSAQASVTDLNDLKSRANTGERAAQAELGLLYANGDQVEKDLATAKSWWEKAAAQESADAQYYLGYMYSVGAEVEKNLHEAKKWWEKAAEQDNVPALFNLGMLHINGEIVSGSYVKAGEYFVRAANLGHVQSQFNLGVLYLNGFGYPKDVISAYAWIKLAADQGHPDARQYQQSLDRDLSQEQHIGAQKKFEEIKSSIIPTELAK